jgi:hypothetical protein
LSKVQEEYNNTNKEIEFAKNDLDLLEKYAYSKFFVFYDSQFNKLDQELSKVKDNQQQQQRIVRKISKDYKKLEIELREMQEIYLKASTHLKNLIPKSEEPHLLIWERINFNNPIRDLEFSDNLDNEIINFKTLCKKMIDDIEKDKSYTNAKIYQDLVEFLEHYKNSEAIIPGLDKTIPEFIDVLNESNKKYKSSINLIKELNRTIDLLENLADKKLSIEQNFFIKLKELKTLPDGSCDVDSPDPEFDTDDITTKLTRKQNAIQKLDYYRLESSKKNITIENVLIVLRQMEKVDKLQPYFISTEDSLLKRIVGYENQFLQNIITSLRELDHLIDPLKSAIRESSCSGNIPALVHIDFDEISEGGLYDWKKVKDILVKELGWVNPTDANKGLHTSCKIEKCKEYSQFIRFYQMKSRMIPFSAIELSLASRDKNITKEQALIEITSSLGFSLKEPQECEIMKNFLKV